MTALKIFCLCLLLVVTIEEFNCASLPPEEESIEKTGGEQTYLIEPSSDSRQVDTDFLPTAIPAIEDFEMPKDVIADVIVMHIPV